MPTVDLTALVLMDWLTEQAELLVDEMKASELVPAAALLAARGVAMDLHEKRRAALEAMTLHPFEPASRAMH